VTDVIIQGLMQQQENQGRNATGLSLRAPIALNDGISDKSSFMPAIYIGNVSGVSGSI
jgi:hypothetical protein